MYKLTKMTFGKCECHTYTVKFEMGADESNIAVTFETN
jgi:hypothetical protein